MAGLSRYLFVRSSVVGVTVELPGRRNGCMWPWKLPVRGRSVIANVGWGAGKKARVETGFARMYVSITMSRQMINQKL
jgi:hypothetical protein